MGLTERERVAALAALAGAAREAANADARVRSTVQELRAAGVSWTRIGTALGVTRQAAAQRFGRDALPL